MCTLKKANLLIPVFLLFSMQASKLEAFHITEIFEDFDRAFQNVRHEFHNRFHSSQNINDEDQALVNQQLEIVNNIKPEISKDANGIVSIIFPIDNIQKEKIELSLEHGLLHGFMPLENGYFRFVLHPKYLRYEYSLNITKQTTLETPKQEQVQPISQDKVLHDKAPVEEQSTYQQTFSWRTANAFSEQLPLEVDLTKAQSETKNNKLIIRLEPKSYTRLKIRHS